MENKQVEVYRDTNVIASEINLIKLQTRNVVIQSSIEIGIRLKEAKELLPHGQWSDWLKDAVEYSQRTAQNLMKIADEMGHLKLTDSNTQALADLTYTQAVALLRLDSNERENFVEEHNIQSMSTRELEDAIKEKNEALKEKEEALKQLNIMQERVKVALDEKTKITEQMNNAKDSLALKQQTVKELEEQVAKTKSELELTNSSASSAASSEYELLKSEKYLLAEKLEEANEALEKAQRELEEALTNIDEPQEIIKEIRVEVVPEHIAKKISDLERNTKFSEHKAKFKAGFEVIAGLFNEMLDTIDKIGEIDKEERPKYLTAANNLIKRLGEKVGER
jgi:chromosome segregation ATPase